MEFSQVNYLAVGLSTVLAFVLGMAWYSPLMFAKAWMSGHGYTEEDVQGMKTDMIPTYVLTFLCWFVMATILAVVARQFGEGVDTTLLVGVHLWAGFSATVGITNYRFSGKPLSLWVIDGWYQLASITLMSVVLGLWP